MQDNFFTEEFNKFRNKTEKELDLLRENYEKINYDLTTARRDLLNLKFTLSETETKYFSIHKKIHRMYVLLIICTLINIALVAFFV